MSNLVVVIIKFKRYVDLNINLFGLDSCKKILKLFNNVTCYFYRFIVLKVVLTVLYAKIAKEFSLAI